MYSKLHKGKANTIGYDPNFINLVDYDSTFMGNWKTANQGEEFYLHFDILANGGAYYTSDHKWDGEPPIELNQIAKYDDGYIFLEGHMKINIDRYPMLSNDTVEQYNFNGPIKYVYSAIMIIDGNTVYRVDEVI